MLAYSGLGAGFEFHGLGVQALSLRLHRPSRVTRLWAGFYICNFAHINIMYDCVSIWSRTNADGEGDSWLFGFPDLPLQCQDDGRSLEQKNPINFISFQFFGQSWPPHLSWDTLVHPSLFCMENKSPAPSITVGREQVLRPPLEFNPTILVPYEEGFNIVHLGWTSLPAHI